MERPQEALLHLLWGQNESSKLFLSFETEDLCFISTAAILFVYLFVCSQEGVQDETRSLSLRKQVRLFMCTEPIQHK